ncbi:hypothetical protein [Billgrantia desiderata]|jgi:hypothetical protein|uniref:hypothetical protein n=1 Tax=Billgrantia desiderata TaxID=52021 RepID=UPI001F2D1253|nr:hypothetical protein [Halomonas desiderata]MCE8013906.1 hypothetical protein [Halomonas desiderata]
MAFIRRDTLLTPELANWLDDSVPPPRARDTSAHDALVQRAGRWLRQMGCGAVATEMQSILTQEQPDAIGWRTGATRMVSILVEVKVSRSDFLADRKKPFRQNDEGMGDWRFFMAPPGLIRPDELPEGWGLIEATPHRIKFKHNVPSHSSHFGSTTRAPFNGNKMAEMGMLYSALRRLQQAPNSTC